MVKAHTNDSLITPSAKLAIRMNSVHHQYSERVARPLKSAYFRKQVRTDSMNVMLSGLVESMSEDRRPSCAGILMDFRGTGGLNLSPERGMPHLAAAR